MAGLAARWPHPGYIITWWKPGDGTIKIAGHMVLSICSGVKNKLCGYWMRPYFLLFCVKKDYEIPSFYIVIVTIDKLYR